MLTLKACFDNILEAAEAYDTERSAQKQADKEAQMEKDLNPPKNGRKKKKLPPMRYINVYVDLDLTGTCSHAHV